MSKKKDVWGAKREYLSVEEFEEKFDVKIERPSRVVLNKTMYKWAEKLFGKKHTVTRYIKDKKVI